ncbi:hypothetical protein HMPREF0972_01896 [Actinomyces sp. oral taxon 848 str. F0332]|nr:hypothetical protein HMPREF0972_01896 [Actinomyces sp. oral taxon 848 str. F0332]
MDFDSIPSLLTLAALFVATVHNVVSEASPPRIRLCGIGRDMKASTRI